MRPRAKLGVVAGVAALTAGAAPRTGEGPTILAVMHKEFTNTTSPYVVVKKQLAAESPDWEKVRAATAKFVALAEALAKNEPGIGDKASWKRLTDRHSGDVKAMDEGAGRGDLEAVQSAYRRVADSCKECHDAHKFRRDR